MTDDETNGGAEQRCDCDTGRMQSNPPAVWSDLGTKTKVVDRCVLALLTDLNSVPKSVWNAELSKAETAMSELRSSLENRMFDEHECDMVGTDVFYGTGNIEEAVIRLDESGVHIESISSRSQRPDEAATNGGDSA